MDVVEHLKGLICQESIDIQLVQVEVGSDELLIKRYWMLGWLHLGDGWIHALENTAALRVGDRRIRANCIRVDLGLITILNEQLCLLFDLVFELLLAEHYAIKAFICEILAAV